ncbi:MAG: hypothetical protein HY659_12380 [Rhizobiales bacterium]|nr:hypothetical protein [Hyphomicrobiales bacterium]
MNTASRHAIYMGTVVLLFGGIGYAAAQDKKIDPSTIDAIDKSGKDALQDKSGQGGKAEPSAAATPGASADTDNKPSIYLTISPQTTPSVYSERNAANDKLVTTAHTLGLSEAQKRMIASAVSPNDSRATSGQGSPDAGSGLAVADELSAEVAMHDFPAPVAAAVPGIETYKYVTAGGKILIVNPSNWIVVGVITK